MAIEIHTKKVFVSGAAHYQVFKVSALKPKQLPVKYLKTYPHCYQAGLGGLVIKINTKQTDDKFILRGLHHPKDFEELIKLVEKCGDRLMEINNFGETERWEGKHIFII